MKTALTFAAFPLAALASSAHAQTPPAEAADAIEEAQGAPPQQSAPSDGTPDSAPDSASKPIRVVPFPKDYSALDPRPADYPPASWAANEEGTVEYSLSVDATGQPTSCSVIYSSGFAALDNKACEIALSRAEFDPQTDEEGTPIAGIHRDWTDWQKREPEFPGTATIHVAYVVDKNGNTKYCDVIEISGEISDRMRRQFDKEPCPGMERRARSIYRDENGNPVSKRVELQVIIKTETVEE